MLMVVGMHDSTSAKYHFLACYYLIDYNIIYSVSTVVVAYVVETNLKNV